MSLVHGRTFGAYSARMRRLHAAVLAAADVPGGMRGTTAHARGVAEQAESGRAARPAGVRLRARRGRRVPPRRARRRPRRRRRLRAGLRHAAAASTPTATRSARSSATSISIVTSGCTCSRSSPAPGRSIRCSTPGTLPNLATIVYDRSPFQERAPTHRRPRLARPGLAALRPTIFDVARTPYPPLARGRRPRRAARRNETDRIHRPSPDRRRRAGGGGLRLRRTAAALRRVRLRARCATTISTRASRISGRTWRPSSARGTGNDDDDRTTGTGDEA